MSGNSSIHGRDTAKKGAWLPVPLIAAAVLFAAALFLGFRGKESVPPVRETGFTLNGEAYPTAPVLQDFIVRGWKQEKPVEHIGGYTEETGPVDIVPTGYRLTDGKSKVNAYLDVDACKDGTQPGECRVRSLSLYGDSVESFRLAGKELAGVDRAGLTALLGAPEETAEAEYGVTYSYSVKEKGIRQISFTFTSKAEEVGQVFIVFNNTSETADSQTDLQA